ncbi:hypothetical protein [Pseudonocardia xishanensis]|uniref:Uncharacterized protein n=1 Tax=Pseudonocardia xishanensis TaxID=630995 RepID=A0ABP8S1X0_9PSEU
MAAEHREWTHHGPGRALLWWPFLSFGTMAVFPDAGIAPIVATGAALAVLGLVAALAARVLRRRILLHRAATRPAALPATAAATVIDVEPTTRAA